MTSGERILAGIASFSPLAGFLACIAMGLYFGLRDGRQDEVTIVLDVFVLTVACTGGLLFLHISHVWRNKHLATTSRKLGWTLGLLVCPVVAMPVYWYLYVWKEPQHGRSTASDPETDTSVSGNR